MVQDLTPEKIYEVGNGFWPAQILLTANKLRIFDLLESKPLTAQEVSEKLKADLRGVQLLLNALVSLNFLTKEKDIYQNTPLSSTFLVSGKPRYKGYALLHLKDMWESWGKLEEAVLSGKPVARVREKLEEKGGFSDNFILAMQNHAVEMLDLIARTIGIEKYHFMLDIGGGPGTYSIAFAQRNKNLKVALLDLPPVLGIAKEMINKNKLTERFQLIEGDFFEVDFGRGYDLIYLSHIIHQNGGDENLILLKKAYQSLVGGGKLVIHDFFLEDSGAAPLFPAIFALNMLVHTEKGRSYKFSEVESWLNEVGFTRIMRKTLIAQSALLIATKQKI